MRTVGDFDSEGAGVLRHLFVEGDLSAYGLVNAVTHYSHDVENYDRATEFESLDGKLIELSSSSLIASTGFRDGASVLVDRLPGRLPYRCGQRPHRIRGPGSIAVNRSSSCPAFWLIARRIFSFHGLCPGICLPPAPFDINLPQCHY
jgi:hypothetical protein